MGRSRQYGGIEKNRRKGKAAFTSSLPLLFSSFDFSSVSVLVSHLSYLPSVFSVPYAELNINQQVFLASMFPQWLMQDPVLKESIQGKGAFDPKSRETRLCPS